MSSRTSRRTWLRSACGSRDRRALTRTILAIATLTLAAAACAQDRLGDAMRGARLFEQHRCVVCHPINGLGGSGAPDMARRPSREFTPSALAASLWNHGPAMWRAMAARNLPVPKLEPAEVADLFAYFYALRYFDPPGDAARGKDVFVSARCSSCHASETGLGPPVSKWRATTDPVQWAQQMWNHTGGMTREAQRIGVPWPELSVQQMVDLMVYVQNLPGARLEPPSLRTGDPASGARLFELQGCARCHTVGEPTSDGRIDLLGRTRRFHTLTEFAVSMWNHAPKIRRRAERLRVDILPFNGEELSDVIAYLFEKGYFQELGSPARGARLYRSRQCAACHESGPGPALASFRGRFSSLTFTSATWKHGPQMLEQLEKRGLRWPSFTGTEMADLIAYLNR